MTINHLFLAFMAVVGAAVGIILVVKPEARDFRVSPYFWVLLAMVLFELLAFARGRGAPGTVVTMDVRVSGFLMAIVLMVVIPIVSGAAVLIGPLPSPLLSARPRPPKARASRRRWRRAATLWQCAGELTALQG
jgi:hypothetical protein